jgi:hypothetical protein
MYFNVNAVVLAVFGVAFLVFGKHLANFVLSCSGRHKLTGPKYHGLLYIWPTRFMGVICLILGFLMAMSGPSQSSLKKTRNRLALLENGVLAKAEVVKVVFQQLAPAGWEVVYKFNAKDPVTEEEKAYVGSTQGPKKYYARLSKGDEIVVIYQPGEPKLNCEINCFLNSPSFRHTFKKASKLNLLDRFRNTFVIEEYSFEEWYRQQQKR